MDVVQNVNMNYRPSICDTTLLIKELNLTIEALYFTALTLNITI